MHAGPKVAESDSHSGRAARPEQPAARSERWDGDFLYQLFELEWRCRQDAWQNASQPCDLGVKLACPGRSVHLSTVLIRAQRLALISRLSADRGTLCPFLLQLFSTPCSLLRLMQALLAPLYLGPGSKHAAIPTSRHRSSPKEQYDHDETKIQEFAIW